MGNYIDNVTETLYSTPLWVQEVVYIDLKRYLESKCDGIQAFLNDCDLYPAYVPTLTFKGKKEIETHEHGLDANIYKCFTGVLEGKRIVDITLNNFWTLEETSNYLAFGIENEYIKAPDNMSTLAAIFYIGSKIRLGEYIKRLKKIDIVQLDDVLRKQKQLNDSGSATKKRIGEILIEMGLVANNDIDSILCIKEEAKKRCIVQKSQQTPLQPATHIVKAGNAAGTVSSAGAQGANPSNAELIAKINQLTQENNLLKSKLRTIFNIQNQKK